MRTISYLIIILLTPVLILLNFRSLVFSHSFYKSEFSRLNVYEKFQSVDLVNLQSKRLINYLCCSEELGQDFFSQRERLHLADVKNMIGLVNVQLSLFLLAMVTVTLFLILKKQNRLLFKGYRVGSLATIAVVIFMWVLSKINFDLIFLQFHYISFQNDYWSLPENSNLIKLFPQQFFADFANRIALQTIIMGVLIFAVSLYFSRINNKHFV